MRLGISVVVFCVACGSSAVVPDGGATDSGADTQATDGGSTTSNSTISTYTAPDGGFGANAVFSAPNTLAVGCPTTVLGSCISYNCTGSETLTYSSPSDNPGTLTVSGGNPNLVLTLKLVAAGAYTDSKATSTSTFPPGTTITFMSTGATVPAFQDTLTVPATPTITGPSIDGGAIAVSRATDFPITWTGGDADEVAISINNTGATGFVQCEFPASASTTSAVIPAAMLSKLAPGNGTLGFTAAHAKIVTAGAYKVKLLVAPEFLTSTPVTLN